MKLLLLSSCVALSLGECTKEQVPSLKGCEARPVLGGWCNSALPCGTGFGCGDDYKCAVDATSFACVDEGPCADATTFCSQGTCISKPIFGQFCTAVSGCEGTFKCTAGVCAGVVADKVVTVAEKEIASTAAVTAAKALVTAMDLKDVTVTPVVLPADAKAGELIKFDAKTATVIASATIASPKALTTRAKQKLAQSYCKAYAASLGFTVSQVKCEIVVKVGRRLLTTNYQLNLRASTRAVAITPQPTPSLVTQQPTAAVTQQPTAAVTEQPTAAVTEQPTAAVTGQPTAAVTEQPTAAVTEQPTAAVTEQPTAAVTEQPTAAVTEQPTTERIRVTQQPTTQQPTAAVTEQPTAGGAAVTGQPTAGQRPQRGGR